MFAQDTILSENFENGIPSSWTIIDNDHLTPDSSVSEYDTAWISIVDPLDDSTVNHCASATSFFNPAGKTDRWLITPPITLGDFGNYLNFRAASYDPSFPETYVIKIGTDLNDLSTFQSWITFVAEPPYWSAHDMKLDSLGYNNQTIYIAFDLISEDSYKFLLDDISVRKEDHLAANIVSAPKLTVFPNPSADFIHIVTDKKGLQKEIYNMEGRQIFQTTDDKIDVSAWKNGLYLIRFPQNGQTVKFVKK